MTIQDTIIGLMGGFLISLLTFYVSQKIRKTEAKRERLRKHVRIFFPLLRELRDDLSYAISMKMRGETVSPFKELLEKVVTNLDSFEEAYMNFRKAGLEPELESSDKSMSVELKGVFTLWKMDDHDALHNELNVYYSKVLVCLNLLEDYLKR